MEDYRKYLAQQILTEDKLVTYRLLSRALKVHVNTAKQMLYEFHKWQNEKRPGTLHATYLVYGTKRKGLDKNGDVEMMEFQSEPEVPFSEEVPVHTLYLVKEEQLEDVLKQYEEVTSIHVYSLAPHPLKDLQLLADTAQQVLKLSAEEDSPTSGKTYGMIANPNVRKRDRRGAVHKTAATAPAAKKVESKPQIKQESKPASKAGSTVAFKEESKAATKETKASANAAKKSSAAPLKQQASSGGIGQMFARAAANPKKPKPAAQAPEPAEVPSPALSDEGEDDSEMPDVKQEGDGRNVRKDRQAALRRMMEESDEDEPESKAASPVEEPMEVESPPPEPESKADEGPAEVVSSTSNGRKRGRRQVIKKKQVMDEQGYLVTMQETGWESFSEDEASTPPPPKPKPQVGKAAPPTKGKTGGKGAGQGNIMSFFSKK